MKKKMLLTVVAASSLLFAGCNSGDKTSTAIKGEDILKTKYGTVTDQDLYEAMKGRYGEHTLQELVFEKVLSENYKLSDKELEKEFKQFEEMYGHQFEEVVKSSGFASVEDFKRSMKVSMLKEKAALDKIPVSDKEMQDYYAKMNPEIKASHILVSTEKEAKEIKVQLDKGGDFAKLAKEKSKDPGSAVKGGDLDYFKEGEMVPEFEATAYKLNVGQISEPVKSQFGYHIIKVTDKKEKKPFEEMKAEIKETIAKEKLTPELVEESLQKELDKAEISIKDDAYKDTFKAEKK